MFAEYRTVNWFTGCLNYLKCIVTPTDQFWPGRAKDDSRLLGEKLSFAELRYRKFRRHPQRPVVAETVNSSISVADVQNLKGVDNAEDALPVPFHRHIQQI